MKNYSKPEVTVLGNASAVIEYLSTDKSSGNFLDHNRVDHNAIASYDLDE